MPALRRPPSTSPFQVVSEARVCDGSGQAQLGQLLQTNQAGGGFAAQGARAHTVQLETVQSLWQAIGQDAQ